MLYSFSKDPVDKASSKASSRFYEREPCFWTQKSVGLLSQILVELDVAYWYFQNTVFGITSQLGDKLYTCAQFDVPRAFHVLCISGSVVVYDRCSSFWETHFFPLGLSSTGKWSLFLALTRREYILEQES